MTKICSKCKIEKESFEFNRQGRSKDQLGSYCKECIRIYDKTRNNNPDSKAKKKLYDSGPERRTYQKNGVPFRKSKSGIKRIDQPLRLECFIESMKIIELEKTLTLN